MRQVIAHENEECEPQSRERQCRSELFGSFMLPGSGERQRSQGRRECQVAQSARRRIPEQNADRGQEEQADARSSPAAVSGEMQEDRHRCHKGKERRQAVTPGSEADLHQRESEEKQCGEYEAWHAAELRMDCFRVPMRAP